MERGEASSSRPGGTQSRKPKLGKHVSHAAVSTPAAPAGRRGRSPPRTCPHSRSMASEPTSPAMLMSFAATAAALRASAGSSRTSSAHRSPRCSNAGKNGKSGRIVPSVAAATTRLWPTSTRVIDRASAHLAEPEGGDRGLAVVAGEVAADDRDPEEPGGVAHPLEGGPGGLLRGRDGVDDPEGLGAHRHDVVDVGQHGREARAPGVVGDERGPQRLAAGDHRAGRGAHDGAVVSRPAGPVGVPEDLADQADLGLRQQPGVLGDDPDDLVQLARHGRSHTAPPRSSRIVGAHLLSDLPSTAMGPASFLTLPSRPPKPRSSGLTHVLDTGVTPAVAADLLGGTAPYVDIWKTGWGTAYVDGRDRGQARRAGRPRRRVAASAARCSEIAWAQGAAEACLAWADDGRLHPRRGVAGHGADVARREAASWSGAPPTGSSCVTEVGAKDPAQQHTARAVAATRRPDRAAGAALVVTEGRQSGTVGIFDGDGAVRERRRGDDRRRRGPRARRVRGAAGRAAGLVRAALRARGEPGQRRARRGALGGDAAAGPALGHRRACPARSPRSPGG